MLNLTIYYIAYIRNNTIWHQKIRNNITVSRKFKTPANSLGKLAQISRKIKLKTNNFHLKWGIEDEPIKREARRWGKVGRRDK